jgi:hypothetical protein
MFDFGHTRFDLMRKIEARKSNEIEILFFSPQVYIDY